MTIFENNMDIQQDMGTALFPDSFLSEIDLTKYTHKDFDDININLFSSRVEFVVWAGTGYWKKYGIEFMEDGKPHLFSPSIVMAWFDRKGNIEKWSVQGRYYYWLPDAFTRPGETNKWYYLDTRTLYSYEANIVVPVWMERRAKMLWKQARPGVMAMKGGRT